MKKILTLVLTVAFGSLLCFQCTKDKLIPVTTASEKARAYYNEGMAAYDDVYFDRFIDLLLKALKEDPDFFMANYGMATYSLYYKDEKRFREYGGRAEKCEAILSAGEIIMKDAISMLLKKNDSDVTAYGKKLVKLYPKDVRAYQQLSYYQSIIKDYNGQEETLKKSLEIAANPAPVYNALGYIYMTLGKADEAEAAFEKYMELEPGLPNPYDSKGDYFMFIKDYKNAYLNYLKANEIDSTWSYNRAMMAKAMADSLGMK